MTEFLSHENSEESRLLLEDLLDTTTGLTDREIDIIESLDEWEGNFTVKQGDLIETLYERRC